VRLSICSSVANAYLSGTGLTGPVRRPVSDILMAATAYRIRYSRCTDLLSLRFAMHLILLPVIRCMEGIVEFSVFFNNFFYRFSSAAVR